MQKGDLENEAAQSDLSQLNKSDLSQLNKSDKHYIVRYCRLTEYRL